ncbi:twin-arginine translocation signal domain-containing protein [Halostella sp. JP-L12]|uniref:twin-arginine translocation signal domain-containing protein n=1 Tax=Halostella TaxID=1843185 RepID=UPI000EF7AE70|nr:MULTISPECIES: twin-arginine translocation signal domain-containing protein [Halostella]NHN47676.1 twin-arginine translocation signal domain-containing protein [Halostella sp. JP-L12]
MERRDFLTGAGALGATAVAGCTDLLETESARSVPPVVEDRPDAVYHPTHVEGMEMIGTATDGDYAIGLMYSFPHRFWTVTASVAEKVSLREQDDVHLMASVWDPETETVLPIGSGPRMTIERDGEEVAAKAPWTMISQNMAFHFGDNFSLDGDGTYDVTIDLPGTGIRRLGAFEGRFGDAASVSFEFDYSRDERDGLTFETFDEKQGEPGAVDLMEMDMVPTSVAPAAEDLPGEHLAEGTTGDAVFQVVAVENPAFIDENGTYLAASPRTPYNQVPIPLMSLSGTVERDGETAFEDPLQKSIQPDLGYHYGASVGDLGDGDEVTLAVDAPPQVSRHEGYETAFLDMPPVEFTVGE